MSARMNSYGFCDFLAQLVKDKGEGYRAEIESDGAIRIKDGEGDYYCPLTFACKLHTGEWWSIGHYDTAGAFCGVYESGCHTVAAAADGRISGEAIDVRTRLLLALAPLR